MKPRIKVLNGLVLLWFAFAGISAFAAADTSSLPPEAQDHFRSIAGQLRCPTCTGLSVLDSDAPFSVQIQDLVKEQINAGRSEEQILDFFTERYGPWILREPPKQGFNLLAWLIPLLLMIAGPILIWWQVWLRKGVTTNILALRTADDIMNEFERALATARQGGKS